MFHTFQAASSDHSGSSKNNAKSRRQSSTTHACEECRRRKIRCDGKQPCSHCEWYKHPKLCKYSKKQPRVVPSQKLLEELSGSLRQSHRILEQLFPNADISQLGNMPRAELIDLVLSSSNSQVASSSSTSPQTSPDYALARTQSEDTSANLDALEQEPIPDANWDESRLDQYGVPPISDDVNALSMSVGRQSSYLGVSSVAAALRVISKITTALESVILSSPHRTVQPTRSSSPRRSTMIEGRPSIKQPILDPKTMIDAYFEQIHPLIPMIDEARFRRNFDADERNDPSWKALVNIVYAMGTIAASNCEDNSHLMFYNRAKDYLDLETFGNGHIEALQALGIMGGYYLHYENRPNMAGAIMGAAMRMACALGLHREYTEQPNDARTTQIRQALLIPREIRRRTWWSLFCLDTWASTTTGRPSLGRISSGVTVQPPSSLSEKSGSELVTDEDIAVMVLCQEITFCKIATRVQDRLAEQPLLPFDETARFDAELRHWYNNMPPMMRYPSDCPERARVPRAVVSWRYHNLRLVLHRPVLLNNALRSSLDNTDVPSDEEVQLVNACRTISGEAIADIQNQWVPCQVSGWNAVWLLFQASMVPLVTLFAEWNRGNSAAISAAQVQIEAVLQQLDDMSEWSLTAKRSRDVVSKIYERNRLMMAQAREFAMQQQTHHNQVQYPHQQPTQVLPQRSVMDVYGQQQHSGIPIGQDTHLNALYGNAMMSQQQSGGLAGHMGIVASDNTMHTDDGMTIGGAPGFMTEDELNAFWNQIMWGEGEMPGFVMDTSFDAIPGEEHSYGFGQ